MWPNLSFNITLIIIIFLFYISHMIMLLFIFLSINEEKNDIKIKRCSPKKLKKVVGQVLQNTKASLFRDQV